MKNYHLSCSLKKGNPIEGEEYRIRYFFHLMYWQSFDENHSNILQSFVCQIKLDKSSLPT
ncbi:hypothetical protein [Enterococcus faecium]|uniref:hypothetical protein n=1 Tax=Enterococcus faecium TaxID=1352 RepID=UPI001F5B6A47|nr:hypothetical protein [Enterococcus faecium]